MKTKSHSSLKQWVIAILVMLAFSPAFAAPPYDVTVTFSPPATGGAPDGYNLYVDDCAVTGAIGSPAGTVTSGQTFARLRRTTSASLRLNRNAPPWSGAQRTTWPVLPAKYCSPALTTYCCSISLLPANARPREAARSRFRRPGSSPLSSATCRI